jgi:glutathione S-transferase
MTLDLHDPLISTYAIAACLMILKAVSMSWLTVVRMMRANSGFRSPEDLRKSPFNPNPRPDQTAPNDYVDRVRRIQLNDLENLPFFLIAGFLYVLSGPSLAEARWLLYGYVVSRLLHFAAYISARSHEMRATFWTIGSLILVYMSVRVLWVAIG